MSEGIIVALITTTGGIIGGIIGALINYRATIEAAGIKVGQPSPPKARKTHWLTGIISGVIIGGVITLALLAFIGILPVGFTLSPVYDDFNSGEGFNQDKWEKYEDFACDVEQKDGQVVFSADNTGSSSAICSISAGEVILEEAGFIEAKLSTTDDAKGDYSIGILEFSNGTFEEGTQNWIAQCGLRHTQEETPIELFFNVHSTFPDGEPEIFKTVPASAGRWYKMRLEIDPDFEEVRCYANDKFIGTYNPPDKAPLIQDRFDRHILGYWTPGTQATFFADDVRISPIQ